MPWVTSATIRFRDVDRAGVAFFAVVFPLCHDAWEEVWAQAVAPASLEETFVAGAWPLPVVRAEADFVRPMRLGDRLAVTVALLAIGARSLAVAYRLAGAQDGQPRATARLTHAAVDGAGRPRPVPGEVRDRLLAILGPPGAV